jgi:hypothetical protein
MKREDQDNSMFLFLAGVLLVFMLIPAFYAARAGAINAPLLALAKFQLRAFVPFSEEAQQAWAHISGLNPADLTWERMSAILSYTGKWIRWPLALCLGLLGLVCLYLGRVADLIRRFNMESLLSNNSESFACLRPIVGRGKYLLSPASHDAGPWRIARSPLQFALEQGLLLDAAGNAFAPEQVLRRGLGYADSPAYGKAILDEAGSLAVLQKQLGPVFGGAESLGPLRKALAAALLAYSGGDKSEAVALLDTLSSSYTEEQGIPACPILDKAEFQAGLDTILDRQRGILAEPLPMRHSAFELVWFMALLTRARKKGVLAPAQFLFLRPLDRPLWYALHHCGGRVAWAEGFAAWAHYAAEEKAGTALSEPQLARAVKSLRNALDALGWLADKPVAGMPESSPDKTDKADGAASKAAPAPELVFAPAEEDVSDDYDANFDPALRRQQI